MAARDTRFEERAEDFPFDGLSAQESKRLIELAITKTFDELVMASFDLAKRVIAGTPALQTKPSFVKSRYVNLLGNRSMMSKSTGSNLELRDAYISLLWSAAFTIGKQKRPAPSPADRSYAEASFHTVYRWLEATNPNAPGFLERLELIKKALFLFFYAIQMEFERAQGFELTLTEKEIYGFLDKVTDPPDQFMKFSAFTVSFKALNLSIGFLAAEVLQALEADVPDLIDPSSKTDTDEANSFCFDLYLYMGFRYHVISRNDYNRLRSKTVTNHFTSKIGKSVILLSHAYRTKFFQNWLGLIKPFRMEMKTCNSLNYVTTLVRLSIEKYPSSSYRYMVLLCLICDITLALYYYKKPEERNLELYLNKACKYYEESGMNTFEILLRNHDDFRGLREHADRISKAWRTLSAVAIDAEVKMPPILLELMEETNVSFEGGLEMVSSKTSREDSEPDASKGLDYEDIPEGQIRAAQLGSSNVEGKTKESWSSRSNRTSPKARKSSPAGRLGLLDLSWRSLTGTTGELVEWLSFNLFDDPEGAAATSQTRSVAAEGTDTPADVPRRASQPKPKRKKSKKSKGRR